MPTPTKKPRKIASLVLFACIALIGGAYYARSITPPPMPDTMDEAIALLKSDRFQSLSDRQKRDYHDRIAEVFGPLDREERRQIMRDNELRSAGRDMFRAMVVSRAREYALADEVTQQAMIVEAREQISQRFAERQGRPEREEPSEEERRQRQERHKERIEDWVNSGNAQDWALVREYWHAIRAGWDNTPPRPGPG